MRVYRRTATSDATHPGRRSLIQFAVRSDGVGGGALKLRHYFEHALASEFGDCARAYMPVDTDWSAANPWTVQRRRVRHAIDWPQVAVLVISGWGWDRFVPPRFHAAPPFRVVYLVQSFGRIDPADSQFRHLANPAVRVCVSGALARALRSLGAANGPIRAIKAGIDVEAVPAASAKPVDVVVAGLKNPDLARQAERRLHDLGLRTRLLVEPLPRAAFLEALAEARVALLLPAPREGFYLPALEAMAVGCVVVCPDVQGNDYCAGGVNCIVPDYDLDAVVAASRQAAALPPTVRETLLAGARATASAHGLAEERTAFQRLLREVYRG